MPQTSARSNAATKEPKDRIETAVQDTLSQSTYYGLRRVSCEFDGEVLKLCGTVSSYYEKQIAQSLVLPLLNRSIHFENHLKVVAAVAK